jgi:hypothetical protein
MSGSVSYVDRFHVSGWELCPGEHACIKCRGHLNTEDGSDKASYVINYVVQCNSKLKQYVLAPNMM